MRLSRIWQFCPVIVFWLTIGLLFGLIGQSEAEEKTARDIKPAPEAESLWAHITRTDVYTDWKPFPAKGKDGLYFTIERGRTPAKNPHGAYMRLFINEIAFKSAQQNKTGTMPNGAILVLENYGRDKKTLLSISAMHKVEGFAPKQGDWFWATFGPDGKVVEEGSVQSCIDCHGAKKNTDWRFAGSRGQGHGGHQGHGKQVR
ncbi:MAG: cytochrome P460 family protein [Syntrophobacteraceae bacterium]